MLPDLVIVGLGIALESGPGCDYRSTGLGLRVWIANQGPGPAGPFLVEANGTQRLPVPGLDPGQQTPVWFAGYVNTGGNRATVDATEVVEEIDEGNNTLSRFLPIPTPPPTCTPTPTPAPAFTATPTTPPQSSPTPSPTPAVAAAPTATAMRTPTLTPPPTPLPTPSGPDLQIACIFYDGVVSRQEPDEYVEIVNLGDAPESLEGWSLADADDGAPTFAFPSGFVAPGGVVRVYTNEVHPEWGGYSFGRGTAIWNNGDPDTAGLIDPSGATVSTKTYPPGCG